MPNEPSSPLKGFEDAEAAYKRVEPEANALTEVQFSTFNVDVIGATSIILGVVDRIAMFRDEMARLPGFDVRHVDTLADRAKAAWYAVVTNLPEPEPKDFQAMFDECAGLRKSLLTWAQPLVLHGVFDQKAITAIEAGSGNKEIPSDVVSLVVLYRSKWDQIKGICGVTEAQLDRGAAIAPVVFAAISRRENRQSYSQSDSSLRVRRFWTLADVAYDQCLRALTYLRWEQGDAATIAPSLRRNAGPRGSSRVAPSPEPSPEPSNPVAPTPAEPSPATGPVVGGGKDPFNRR